MPRVKPEIQAKVKEYVKSLDNILTKQCTLCNTTLVDIVKKGEAKTRAPQNTIVKEIAKQYNCSVPAGDRITANALENRVRQFISSKGRNKKSKPKKEKDKNSISTAQAFNFFGLIGCKKISKTSLKILYKGYAKSFHTDKGGNNEDMIKLNLCNDLLKTIST